MQHSILTCVNHTSSRFFRKCTISLSDLLQYPLLMKFNVLKELSGRRIVKLVSAKMIWYSHLEYASRLKNLTPGLCTMLDIISWTASQLPRNGGLPFDCFKKKISLKPGLYNYKQNLVWSFYYGFNSFVANFTCNSKYTAACRIWKNPWSSVIIIIREN